MTDRYEDLQRGLGDQYTLEREIGRGGMATVWLARDVKHQRPVALKVLLPELAHALGPERFRREIATAARLQHPHILSVHDSGEAGGQLWFTMPYVSGESLRERLRRENRLTVDEALRITREAAQALSYAHAEGVVHRDIKPENILISRDGSTLVADFGVARALGAGDDGAEHLTQTGSAIGTPTYMSPEQATGEREVDGRADQYALAAVCYEMLVGEPPFSGHNVAALMAARFSTPVPDAQQKRAEVPPRVAGALKKALALKPDDRFPDMAEFVRALTGSQSGFTPVNTQTLSTRTVKRPRRGLYAGAAVAVVVAVVGVAFATRGKAGSAGVPAAASPSGVTRLAVLPFENLGDSADAYFAEGLSDAVRGKLAAVHSMQVTARTSSVQYRNATKPPQQIGQELGVDYLLTGTVTWARNADGTSRVQVNPELVQVSTGSTKWQQPFDASLTDVFKVQADIAGKVASALDVALGTSERTEIVERPTDNLAAYDAFLKGEAVSQGLSVNDPASLRAAAGYYRQAVALDGNFALAWAQLSRAHSLLYTFASSTPVELRNAQDALARAQVLAPDRPATLLAFGQFSGYVRGDWKAAAEAYEKGLQLAPTQTDLLSAAARAELSLGRWDQAMAHLEQAQRLDPRSVVTVDNMTRTLVVLRRWPEARSAADRGLAVAPATSQVILWKALAYLGEGDLAGAQRVLQEAERVIDPRALAVFFATYHDLSWVLDEPRQALVLASPVEAFDGDRGSWALARAEIYWLRGDSALARAWGDTAAAAFDQQLSGAPEEAQLHALKGVSLAYAGRKADAIRSAQRGVALMPLTQDAYNGPYVMHQLARVYIITGDKDQAVAELEPLLRVPYLLSPARLRIDPNFSRLRGFPKFEKLLLGN